MDAHGVAELRESGDTIDGPFLDNFLNVVLPRVEENQKAKGYTENSGLDSRELTRTLSEELVETLGTWKQQ